MEKQDLLTACEALLALQDTDSIFRLPANTKELGDLRRAVIGAKKFNTMKLYVFVTWPESQELMEHDEFIYAGNCSGDSELSSAGFIPVKIYEKMLDID